MTKQLIEIKSQDGTNLSGTRWTPQGQIKCGIILIHGHGEHTGRYGPVSEKFNKNGFLVQGVDVRGHGMSEGKQGHADSLLKLLEDVDAGIQQIKMDYPSLPLIIYGHSMGGNLAANYLIQNGEDSFTGGILSSSWFRLAEVPVLKLKISQLMNGIFPSFTIATELDPNEISSDPDQVLKYVNDPMIHNKISIRLGNELYNSGIDAIKRAGEISIPLLVVHGTEDNLTSFDGSKEFAEKSGENCEFKSWEGMRHETHNEKENEKVLDYMVNWVETVIK